MNEGFFQKGEYIEVSGKLVGFVTEVSADTVEIQKITSAPSGDWLMNEKAIYSNLSSDYEGKYWLKRLKQPSKPLKSFSTKPFI